MRRQILYLSILAISTVANAQEINGGVSYQYIAATQWNKIIQTYNFSRPFIVQKQPLFSGGVNASLTKTISNQKNISQGIGIAYTYMKSRSENENFINTLNLHFLNIEYSVRYSNINKLKNTFGELIFSAISSGLFRNVNAASFIYDDAKSKAFGIGGSINIKVGYWFDINRRIGCSPFFSAGYCPYLYSPNTEAVINETRNLVGNNHTGIFNTQIGLMIRKKSN